MEDELQKILKNTEFPNKITEWIADYHAKMHFVSDGNKPVISKVVDSFPELFLLFIDPLISDL